MDNSMAAEEVIGKTEMVFNLYQSHPAMGFEEYESYEHEIPVSSSAEWTPSQVVAFYDNVKYLAIQAVGSGANRKMHFLSLSNRYENEGNTVVRALIHVGINPTTEEPEELPAHQTTRWAPEGIGYTNPTPCSGSASDVIGARVNLRLGIFQPINGGPGSGNDKPMKGKVISRIGWGYYKLYNVPYDPPIPYPLLYKIFTDETSFQSKHYNSVATNGSNPPWNCLTAGEISGLIIGNLQLGENAKQYVPPVKVGLALLNRELVATRVVPNIGGEEPTSTTKYQEHITEHYFGVVNEVTIPYPSIEDM